jgi:signal transduction histidine kinase
MKSNGYTNENLPPPNRYSKIHNSQSTEIEEKRLKAVSLYEGIGAPNKDSFKEMAHLVKDLIGAYDVGISIVREKDIHCYSCYREKHPIVPREISFSSEVVNEGVPLIIEDLSLDKRFNTNPFVLSAKNGNKYTLIDNHCRDYLFYSGFPLHTRDGLILGALFAVATRPKKLEPSQVAMLVKFARLVEAKMQLQVELHLREKDQNALIFAEKMASMGRLVSGIAHEINTPLQFIVNNNSFVRNEINSILSFLEFFHSNSGNDLSPERLNALFPEFLKRIKEIDLNYIGSEIPVALNQTTEGLNRITELVALLKAYSHPRVDNHTESNLNDCVNYATQITRYEWKNCVDLTLSLDDDLPSIKCNNPQVAQVLINIITNSIDVIKDKKEKDSSFVGKIDLRTFSDNKSVVIQIKDNAGGIPDAVMPRIFEPFFTTKDVGKGSGQGLAISWDIIVNKHKGKLQASSDYNLGTTTFEITLPVDAA